MPWLDDATLFLARKTEILSFLQSHMPIELLRQHKLNGNSKSIAKKVSKDHLHSVYSMALKDPTMLVSEEAKHLLDEQSAAQVARQKEEAEEAQQAQKAAQAAAINALQQGEDDAAAAATQEAAAERSRHEARLKRWYTEYCPEKLPRVGEVLDEYRGREYKLWQELGMQYGPEPAAPYTRPPPAAGAKPFAAEQTDGLPRLLEFSAENNLTGLCCLVPGLKTKEVKPAPPPGQIEYVLTEPVTANLDVPHPDSGYTALMLCIAVADDSRWRGAAKFHLVRSFAHHLLEYGASTQPRSSNGSTALMMAAQRGRADVARVILEFESRRGLLTSCRPDCAAEARATDSQGSSTLDWQSDDGMSALHWAAAGEWRRADPSDPLRASPPELVRLLLEAGASANAPSSKLGMTPLMLACMHCRGDEALALQVVELLLRPPVPFSADWQTKKREQRDDWRVKLPATDGVRLPNLPPSSQRAREQKLQKDAEETALVGGDVAPVPAPAPEAQSSGADPDAAARGGLRALHLAAVDGRAAVVRALLGANADKDARLQPTNEGAYHLAVAVPLCPVQYFQHSYMAEIHTSFAYVIVRIHSADLFNGAGRSRGCCSRARGGRLRHDSRGLGS